MFWVLMGGGVWGASIIVFAWLLCRAPLFDENGRPMASATNISHSRGDIRIGSRTAAQNRLAGALARSFNSGRPPSRHRSFRLTR
jgi:hypothetical protein